MILNGAMIMQAMTATTAPISTAFPFTAAAAFSASFRTDHFRPLFAVLPVLFVIRCIHCFFFNLRMPALRACNRYVKPFLLLLRAAAGTLPNWPDTAVLACARAAAAFIRALRDGS